MIQQDAVVAIYDTHVGAEQLVVTGFSGLIIATRFELLRLS